MALRDFFGGKGKGDGAGVVRESLGQSTHLAVVDGGSFALATVLCEKYTEHEAQALFNELVAAASQRKHNLVIDLHKVMMLASAGIGSLIHIHKQCDKGGGRLVLAGIDGDILDILKLSRMDRLLTIVGSVDDAARKFR